MPVEHNFVKKKYKNIVLLSKFERTTWVFIKRIVNARICLMEIIFSFIEDGMIVSFDSTIKTLSC